MDEFLSPEKREAMRKYALPIGFFCIALISLLYGLIIFFGQKQKQDDITFSSNSQIPQPSAKERQTVFVDIEGAVEKPGVYEMDTEGRLKDALVKAGGLSESANRELVAKTVNLAMKISDGMKLYIPSQSEQTAVLGSQISASSQSGSVNINTASEQELDSLSGIGSVTANKIISGRPYNDINELVTKKIVTQKVFDKLKGNISLY